MDIAYAHLLHKKVLKKEKLEKKSRSKEYEIIEEENPPIQTIPFSPTRCKVCSHCGQSIYFCKCLK